MFVATCLERGPGLLADHAGRQVIAELLSLGQASLRDTVTTLAATADARAQVRLLGMVLAALEGPRRTRGVTRQATTSQCQGRPTTSHSWPPTAIRARPSSRCSPGSALLKGSIPNTAARRAKCCAVRCTAQHLCVGNCHIAECRKVRN